MSVQSLERQNLWFFSKEELKQYFEPVARKSDKSLFYRGTNNIKEYISNAKKMDNFPIKSVTLLPEKNLPTPFKLCGLTFSIKKDDIESGKKSVHYVGNTMGRIIKMRR